MTQRETIEGAGEMSKSPYPDGLTHAEDDEG